MFEFIKRRLEARKLLCQEQEEEIVETIQVAGRIYYNDGIDLQSRVFLIPVIRDKKLIYMRCKPGYDGSWQTFVDVDNRNDNYIKVLYKKKNKFNNDKAIKFIQLDMHISHPDDLE